MIDNDIPDPPAGYTAHWPANEYRYNQHEIFREAAGAIFGKDSRYDTVIIDAPTGIGKSVINSALCNIADSAFYTTPQTSLRKQLEDDDMLYPNYRVLRARADYQCEQTERQYNCDECPINDPRTSPESDTETSEFAEFMERAETCMEMPGCTYWKAKEAAMGHSTAVLTFAYLIIDKYLPIMLEMKDEPNRQISFGDRHLLVIDECHTLEGQVASMFAGFSVSPENLPGDVYHAVAGNITIDTFEVDEKVMQALSQARRDAQLYKREYETTRIDDLPEADQQRIKNQIDACDSFIRKANLLEEDFAENRPWVVSPGGEDERKPTIQFQPVDVDKFLEDFVWSRANKIVLSSATIPYNTSPGKWLKRIGLDPARTHYISSGSPFPVENRPIHAENTIGKMSSGGFNEHKDSIISRVRELATKHDGEQGLIHTSSYHQANELYEELEDIAVLHSREDHTPQDALRRWERDDKPVLLSPAMAEGVDLKDGLCRWQALVKVSYGNPNDNSRVQYLLEKRNDWRWYNEEAALTIVQSAGRGVRHGEDYCTYYVLDASFHDVIDKTPPWFRDAVHYE